MASMPVTPVPPVLPQVAETPAPAATRPPDPVSWEVPPEVVPHLDDIVIEDDTPVDNIGAEKNQRLLTTALYASWPGPGEGRPFAAFANVGLFHTWKQPPLVSDNMLVLDVRWPNDLTQKENRSYFVWVVGKPPDTVIEIVSNKEGGEDSYKVEAYARIRIPYYVIFDPDERLGGGMLRIYELRGLKYHPLTGGWLEEVGLGLTLWEGTYENMNGIWLRWCDRDGNLILTGTEKAVQLSNRADEALQQLQEERQRADQERQRADQERQRADQERQRADLASQEVENLREKLRRLGAE